MRDFAPVIAAICGFSVVCLGLVAIGALLVFRVTGSRFIKPLFGTVINGRDTEDPDTPPYVPAPPTRAAARDLRSLAQSLDFDAAVNKYRQQGGVQHPPDPNYTPGPSPAPLELDPSAFDIRGTYNRQPSNRPTRRREDESQDEVLGGLFDSEDDGDGGLFG